MTDFGRERSELVEHLRREIRDERVLAAMARVSRELFVPPQEQRLAYEDHPLPIGYGQTISQPYMAAIMTEALGLTGTEKVLEVGTGSGYQTAILAELAREVHSVERLPALAITARKTLTDLDYRNVTCHLAGECLGWPQEAPFDAILVTAGAPNIPSSLLDQLAFGGRMVIPAGSLCQQELYRVTRYPGKNSVQQLGGCRFVALIGRDAWKG